MGKATNNFADLDATLPTNLIASINPKMFPLDLHDIACYAANLEEIDSTCS